MALPKSFSDLGISIGYSEPHLYYHEALDCLLLIVRREDSTVPCERLMIRDAHGSNYCELPDLGGESVSFQSVILGRSTPVVLLLCLRWEQLNETIAGNWDGLFKLDLQSRTSTRLLSPSSVKLFPDCKSVHITQLLSMSEESNTIIAVGGFHRHDGTTEYYVSRISLESFTITKLRQLEAVFA